MNMPYCDWNGCIKWRSLDEGRDCGVNKGIKLTLGEHGGLGDVQGFDQEGKEVEREERWKKAELEF